MSEVGRGPDATDQRSDKLRGGVNRVAQQIVDRWPARGHANVRKSNDYPPLDAVSRNGKIVPYRKYPSGS